MRPNGPEQVSLGEYYKAFEYVDGHLCAGRVRLKGLADEFGTPLYVYHRPAIVAQIETVKAAFRNYPTHLYYSVKANSNLKLLRFMADQGLGFDVVSGGELHRLIAVGISTDRAIFTGVGKNTAELQYALGQSIRMITIESLGEIIRLSEIARSSGSGGVDISLRMNVDVDPGTHPYITTGRGIDKFGVQEEVFPEAIRWLQDHPELRLAGFHMHLGSQITSAKPYREGLERLLAYASQAQKAGFEVRWINCGGGFGISYDGVPVPEPADYAEEIIPLMRDSGAGLVIELGRYLVGPAGCLITEVLYRKRGIDHDLLITDAGMTEFMRQALYGTSHRILPLQAHEEREYIDYDLAGPVCESTDFLALRQRLPITEPGDRLAVTGAGAYGYSMASNYNSRLRPAEVWVTEDGEVELIRRRESLEDLLATEV